MRYKFPTQCLNELMPPGQLLTQHLREASGQSVMEIVMKNVS